MWDLLVGFVVAGVLAAAIAAFTLLAVKDSREPPLAERANVACGRNTIARLEHSPRGFGHREQIAITCRRPDGSIYIEVVKD